MTNHSPFQRFLAAFPSLLMDLGDKLIGVHNATQRSALHDKQILTYTPLRELIK